VKGLGRGACKWHGTAEVTLQEAIVKAIYLRRRKLTTQKNTQRRTSNSTISFIPRLVTSVQHGVV
jgi:hypothetical protein